jgi:sodium/potassium/calcium exchanger 6
LGYILSVVNAPPLVILTLTLPVVDDEGEARAAANALGGDVGSGGALTLKGDERDLFARDAEERDAQPRTSAEVESILDLNTGERRVLESDPWKDEEERQVMANKKRDLDVAGALRGLSAQQMSPLDLTGSADQDRAPGFAGNDADAASVCSSSSGDSIHFTPLSPNTHLILSISQCFLAPPFLAWAVLPEYSLKWFLYSFLFSTLLAISVLLLALRARQVGGYWYSPPTLAFLSLSRCFIGFCVSIAWISTVVNEVVAILQALGLICGLSDAILGLTIFAAGNSLADLVANVTIARAGYPIMAISACFAGPLLNLLLGIGLSGTYILSSSSSSSSNPVYKIELSPTLLSSGAGLLLVLVGTLIVAPLNGFELGRKMGWGLIGAYSIVMATNLAVEISGYGRRR